MNQTGTLPQAARVTGLRSPLPYAPPRPQLQPPRLTRSGNEDLFPLSFVQEWYFREYPTLSDQTDHHISFAARLLGEFSVPAFRQAVCELLLRRTALRTSFRQVGGDLSASVESSVQNEVRLLNLADVAPSDRDGRAREYYGEFVREPFHLADGRPFRVSVVKYGADEHVVLIVLHHIVADAWSIRLILRELATLYQAAVTRGAAPLPAPAMRHCDFVRWEREIDGTLRDQLLDHWRARFSGLPENPFYLPADTNPLRDAPANAQALFRGTVDRDAVEAIRRIARDHRATTFCVVAAAVSLLLHRWSGRDDGLLVVVRDGRDANGLQDVVGCCVTNWALRVGPRASQSLGELVGNIWRRYREDLPYMKLPYYRLNALLAENGQRTASQIVLNYNNFAQPAALLVPNAAHEAPPIFGRAEPLDWRPPSTWVDDRNMSLYLRFTEMPDSLSWSIRCAQRLFSDSTIERLSRELSELLHEVAHPAGARSLC